MARVAIWILVIAIAPGEARAQPCVVRGRSASPIVVEVAPRGAHESDRFSLSVTAVPIAIHPRRIGRDGSTLVDVAGPLRFTGRATQLPWAWSAPTLLADGLVRVVPEDDITSAVSLGRGLVVTTLVGGMIAVSGLTVACRAVGLGSWASSIHSGGGPPDARRFAVLRHRRSVLHSRPAGGTTVVVRVASTRDVTFAIADHRRGWTRVTWSGDDGSRVVGWVADDAIRRVAGGDFTFSTGAIDRAGCPTRDHVRVLGEYVGPAVVHEGASVFAAPDGGAWARAFESTRVRIVRVGSQRWVRVLRVDGIADDTDCELRHAWVRSEDVVVPR